MNFLEKDLEDIICNSDQEQLRKRGLWCMAYRGKFRQLNLGDYGIADMITWHFANKRHLHIDIYELKQDLIDINTLLQAVSYFKGIQRISDEISDSRINITYRIVLIGKRVDTKGKFCYLPDLFSNLALFTYRYDIDGISFKYECDYSITGEVLSPNAVGLVKTIGSDYRNYYRHLLNPTNGEAIY